jgi:class 3 adenylate cyclase/Tfp pilus assembly protein PilF
MVFLCNQITIRSFAQNKQIDSLKNLIAKSVDDSTKVNNLNILSKNFFSIDPALAIQHANSAKELASKINNKSGIALALKNIGIGCYMQSKNVEAIENWNSSLAIYKELGDKLGHANILSNLGAIYFNQGVDAKAIEYYLQSLKLAEEINDSLRLATVLMNIGTVYLNKKANYDKALNYYLQALPICESLKDKDALGTIYVNLGEIYFEKGDNAKSLNYLKKSLIVYEGSENIPYSYIDIGKVYTKIGDFENAIKNEKIALEIASKLNGQLDMARALLGLANTYKQTGETKTAINYFLKGIVIATEIKANIELKEMYKGISEAYHQEKDYGNAYKYQSLLITIKDTLYNIETDKKLGSLDLDFKIYKKQGQINLQEQSIKRQKMIRNTFIIGFAIVIVFAGIVFRQRNRISKEKQRSEELLLNILPEETAEELKNTGTAKAKSYDSVTVLFTDFKDFTKLSEILTPKELVAEINECFSAFDAIMQKYGIEKIKTIGDAYMAAGGLPKANATHPRDVVRAAIAIREFMNEHKIKKQAEGKLFFRIRIGVHTGPVVSGIVGIKKFAYDIWGDTVNTASRMESSGEPEKVNISGTTYELVKDDFDCFYRGKLAAKNKGEIDMYFVDAEKTS